MVAEAQQFDFWLGDWAVFAPPDAPEPGRLLGHNRIERVAGAALAEHWRGASGVHGRSLSAWDPASRAWRQFWVGSDGVVLSLRGHWQDGAMRLDGVLPGAQGAPQAQRIVWTPHADGGLRQQWQVSDDDGATWRFVFVGDYRRHAPA